MSKVKHQHQEISSDRCTHFPRKFIKYIRILQTPCCPFNLQSIRIVKKIEKEDKLDKMFVKTNFKWPEAL